MKITKLILTGTTLALALSFTAYAEADKERKGNKGNKGSEQREAMKKKMLERFDTDKDGKLSDTEKEAIKKERKEIHTAVLAQFDKNNDGELSKDEREGVREWVKANYPDAGPMKGRGGNKKGKGNKEGKGKKGASNS